jgi:hypothetical protein
VLRYGGCYGPATDVSADPDASLGWQPRWSTWRVGFAKDLCDCRPALRGAATYQLTWGDHRLREPGGSLLK